MNRERLLEMLPGALAWGTLIIMVLASKFLPTQVAIFIILFDTYWLLKTIHFILHIHSGFSEMQSNLKIDWLDKIKKLNKPWEEIKHLVIFPMYKEPYVVVKESFESLIKTNYPLNKFIVVLATEEQAGMEAKETAERIEQEYGSKFFKFLVTVHPSNLPGEIPGKGSNETWAGREVKRLIIDPLKILYENIMVSTFDIDTQVFSNYFGRLTYVFLTTPYPQKSSYQPIPLFINDIYNAPTFTRVVSFAVSSSQIMNQARPDKLVTFSSHSTPFKALFDIGFWSVSHVSEDSIIFWQLYLHFNGDWRAVPLFYPVSMDSNVASTFWQSMINVYRQQRRWGWGAENIPYLLYGFSKNKLIPLSQKIRWSFYNIQLCWEWATSAILIFALGWLPVVLGDKAFNLSVLSYSLPEVTRNIMMLTSVGIVSLMILSILILPPKPNWFRSWHYLIYVAQWALLPVTLIVFGAIPGLEAQTRLMLGGKFRLGFWPTPKTRIGSGVSSR